MIKEKSYKNQEETSKAELAFPLLLYTDASVDTSTQRKAAVGYVGYVKETNNKWTIIFEENAYM